ncbi:MAG: phage baseplate assembly protein V, partial [Phycisphaerales bacterium]
KCEGIASLQPGVVVALRGVGERFSGQALISGVRHEFDLVNGWKTHVQFGGVAPSRTAPVVHTGPTPAHGLMVGVVLTNEDPESEYRVRVKLPMISEGEDGLWARVASVDAGADRGLFVRPEVGDEVIVGFVAGDPRSPVILGMLHSSANAAPIEGSDANPQKVYASREGVRVMIDDEAKSLLVQTPGGNSILISDQDQKVTITDQSGNSVEMSSEGISISSASALELKAATEVKIESGTSLSIKGGTELKLEGAALASLNSSGVTKVAGASLQVG